MFRGKTQTTNININISFQNGIIMNDLWWSFVWSKLRKILRMLLFLYTQLWRFFLRYGLIYVICLCEQFSPNFIGRVLIIDNKMKWYKMMAFVLYSSRIIVLVEMYSDSLWEAWQSFFIISLHAFFLFESHLCFSLFHDGNS